MIRDIAGSGVTMEISREGTVRPRPLPLPCTTRPSGKIEDRIVRIVKMTTQSVVKEILRRDTAKGCRAAGEHPCLAAPGLRGDHGP